MGFASFIFLHDQANPFKTHFPFHSFSTTKPNIPIFLKSHYSSSIMVMATTGAQFHVLAVDDTLIDRKLIERLLKTSYQVTAVDSVHKALEFLGLDKNETNSNPDHQDVEINLIITDYCMPGMTGYDLLRKIKGSSSFKDIPVVIMSSDNIPSRINRCLEDGAEEFFLKPVQLSDVNKLRPHLMRTRSKENMEPNVNKRKAMEEIVSPGRTRTRFNELEVI